MAGIDLSSIRDSLPRGTSPARGSHLNNNIQGPMPLSVISEQDETQNNMDIDLIDPQEWIPDEASVTYLRNLTIKADGHPHARRVPVTNSWIQAKFRQIPNHKRDRLLAGRPAEDAFPDYDAEKDNDACLHIMKFAKGSSLAVQACVRNHIKFLRSRDTSTQAFPNGRVTAARRQQFIDNRFHPEHPDLGSTADACCPDLDGTTCSPWNQTFMDSVANDFVSKVSEGWYMEYDLPVEAYNKEQVMKRIKTNLHSMIKKDRRIRGLTTANAVSRAQAIDKYKQRRRSKHHARLRTCDKSPKYSKFFGLLKLVGPEGNSDEETDDEAGTVPLPTKIFPLKWRSRAYERLLHNLDNEAKRKETHPLLHAGPLPTSSRSTQAARPRDYVESAAGKLLPVSCPVGKPSQFYDAKFLRDVKAQGLLPSICVGTAYPHQLPAT